MGAVSFSCVQETFPSQMVDAWSVSPVVWRMSALIAGHGPTQWSLSGSSRPCDHLPSQELSCTVAPSSFGSTCSNRVHVSLIFFFFFSNVCSSGIQDWKRACALAVQSFKHTPWPQETASVTDEIHKYPPEMLNPAEASVKTGESPPFFSFYLCLHVSAHSWVWRDKWQAFISLINQLGGDY